MFRRLIAGAALAAVMVAAGGGQALASPSGLVISQVYGGGCNSGAPYTHDYVELLNAGTAQVPLDGLSLQYASATGTGHFGAGEYQSTALTSATLPADAPMEMGVGSVPSGAGATPPSSTGPLPVRADRPGGPPGRRRAGRQHPRGLPVPRRPGADPRGAPGR